MLLLAVVVFSAGDVISSSTATWFCRYLGVLLLGIASAWHCCYLELSSVTWSSHCLVLLLPFLTHRLILTHFHCHSFCWCLLRWFPLPALLGVAVAWCWCRCCHRHHHLWRPVHCWLFIVFYFPCLSSCFFRLHHVVFIIVIVVIVVVIVIATDFMLGRRFYCAAAASSSPAESTIEKQQRGFLLLYMYTCTTCVRVGYSILQKWVWFPSPLFSYSWVRLGTWKRFATVQICRIKILQQILGSL